MINVDEFVDDDTELIRAAAEESISRDPVWA